MNDKLKDILVVSSFIIFIFGFMIINIIVPDKDISVSERSKLQQFPELNMETLMTKSVESGNFMRLFEEYTLDQFVFRDAFRKIKADVSFGLFMKKDNNNIYVVDGQVSKYWSTMNEGQVSGAAQKFNKIYNQFLKNKNVNAYYSVIPDKNYFIAEENGYPVIDYDKFMSTFQKDLNENYKYIDIFDKLEVNDYYSTDIHWRQEKVVDVAQKLASAMGVELKAKYEEIEKAPFYGVYYGQSALPIAGEKLFYLSNDILKNCKVTAMDGTTGEFYETKIYNEEHFENVDPYDIILEGAKLYFVIENDEETTDKELIVFRDSFGSSLIPLLVEGYKKITVVDLRYVATPMLQQYKLLDINEGVDVLLLYSTEVLNNSSILKVL